jgi:hypothetical protein
LQLFHNFYYYIRIFFNACVPYSMVYNISGHVNVIDSLKK